MSSDVAWAAGLFEGEGSIAVTKQNAVHVSLAMTDLDIVQRFQRIVGCGGLSGWQGAPPRKYTHQWYADGEAATAVVKLLLPYLGERRTRVAIEALRIRAEYIASVTAPRTCPCGQAFQPRFKSGQQQVYCSTRCREKLKSRKRRAQRCPH